MLDVLGRADLVLGVGELAEAVVEAPEVGHALGGEALGVVVLAGGVDNRGGLVVVLENPGYRRDGQLLVDDSQGAGGVGREVDAARGYHLDAAGGVAVRELVVREHRDGHVAAGALRDELGEVVADARVDLGVGAVDGHGELYDLVLALFAFARIGPLAAREREGHDQSKSGRGNFDGFSSHCFSLLFSSLRPMPARGIGLTAVVICTLSDKLSSVCIVAPLEAEVNLFNSFLAFA